VFQLYRVYGLEEVIWENLRPEKPAAEQTLETLGRKRSPRKKVRDLVSVEMRHGAPNFSEMSWIGEERRPGGRGGVGRWR
jgi:UV DNA damage endonuclease